VFQVLGLVYDLTEYTSECHVMCFAHVVVDRYSVSCCRLWTLRHYCVNKLDLLEYVLVCILDICALKYFPFFPNTIFFLNTVFNFKCSSHG